MVWSSTLSEHQPAPRDTRDRHGAAATAMAPAGASSLFFCFYYSFISSSPVVLTVLEKLRERFSHAYKSPVSWFNICSVLAVERRQGW